MSESRRPLGEAFKSLYPPEQALEYAVIDAFTEEPFGGNPAAVVLLPEWKDEKWLQSVAAEFNLSETAYLVRKDTKSGTEDEKDRTEEEDKSDGAKLGSDGAKLESDGAKSEPDGAKFESEDVFSSPEEKLAVQSYDLRWFTPSTEVELCGHATLASAHLLYSTGLVGKKDTIYFHTKSGLLSTRSVGPPGGDAQTELSGGKETPEVNLVELSFPWITTTPASEAEAESLPAILKSKDVVAAGKANDFLLVEVESSDAVAKLQPDMKELLSCDAEGLIATAPGEKESGFDFVSRCFFPKIGVPEDPVTGLAHCILGPYWSTRLNKNHMLARQASKRGGYMAVQVDKKIGRVYLRGQAAVVMTGVLLR